MGGGLDGPALILYSGDMTNHEQLALWHTPTVAERIAAIKADIAEKRAAREAQDKN